jgi:hypothetical protein
VAISGVLLHAIYLGGVWWAIAKGLPAGISGLIAAVQPILTAVLAPTLAGERITRLHWAGIALGFVGIAMVLEPKLLGLTGSVSGLVWPIIVNVAAMVSVTFGTFYQKRFVRSGDLRSVTALANAGGGARDAADRAADREFPLRVESDARAHHGVVGAGLVDGRHRAAAAADPQRRRHRAAALIYLVPPAVALEAYLLFGETMLPLQVAGMGGCRRRCRVGDAAVGATELIQDWSQDWSKDGLRLSSEAAMLRCDIDPHRSGGFHVRLQPLVQYPPRPAFWP